MVLTHKPETLAALLVKYPSLQTLLDEEVLGYICAAIDDDHLPLCAKKKKKKKKKKIKITHLFFIFIFILFMLVMMLLKLLLRISSTLKLLLTKRVKRRCERLRRIN
jgi:predicted nucleic acid-binding Zn ribbon protein